MRKDAFRVMLQLKDGADPEAGLAAAEQRLGRSLLPVRLVRGAGVLSFWAQPQELKLLEGLPGVRKAAREDSAETPHPPVKPKLER